MQIHMTDINLFENDVWLMYKPNEPYFETENKQNLYVIQRE